MRRPIELGQYAGQQNRKALEDLKIVCSISRKGNCWDNAVAEAFFSTLKLALIYRREWNTRAEAALVIAEYIECFYNTHDAIPTSTSNHRSSTSDSTRPA